jgi:hypothetical protein
MILMLWYRNCSSLICARPTASVITTSLNFYSQQQQKSIMGSHRNVLMSTMRYSPLLNTILNVPRFNHHYRNEHRLIQGSTVAFINNSPYHQQQQQSYFSTATKKQRSNNRWRSPILQQPKTTTTPSSSSKRTPKTYKRIYLRNKNNDNNDIDSMISNGKLYRADRVLANRTGKSRKECFQLLHDRRVFIVTDQLYIETSSPSSKPSPSSSSSSLSSPKQQKQQLLLQSNDKQEQEKEIDSTTTDETTPNSTGTDSESNVIQQYRLEVITGPSIKIGMNTNLRIDKYQPVPLPPPLLLIYHKPKVRKKKYIMFVLGRFQKCID